MVTGAYYPEVSGGGLQCRTLIQAIRDRADVIVLTTTRDDSLPRRDEVDGVPVYRIPIDVMRWRSKLAAAMRLIGFFGRSHHRFDIVHLHGFSQKSMLLLALSRLFRKHLALKLTLVGEDDPASVRTKGRLRWWCYTHVDAFFGVSPRLRQLHDTFGLPQEKFWLIPNGVDLGRFRPPQAGERVELRRALGLPETKPLILFVGLFSPRKRPQVLVEAWGRLRQRDTGARATTLVFVGATQPRGYEVDPALGPEIHARIKALSADRDAVFIERTHRIDQYYRAADVFVLPSTGEGLPNALLEAMASGLACVVTKLDGSTDTIVEHGVNGLLVPPEDPEALERTLEDLLADPVRADMMGRQARQTVEARFAIRQTAERCLEAYRCLLAGSR